LGRGLANEEGHGHFLAAIDVQADFVFAGFGKLEVLDAHHDGSTGGRGAGRDLDIYLLRGWRGVDRPAIGIYDGKLYFFDAFFKFSEAEFRDKAAADGNGKLGNEDNVRGSQNIQLAIGTGPRSKAKCQHLRSHAGIVSSQHVLVNQIVLADGCRISLWFSSLAHRISLITRRLKIEVLAN
jgi:hypothetical protein